MDSTKQALDSEAVIQGLMALKPATMVGQVRPYLPAIDQQVAAGVSLGEILAYLNSVGIAITLGSLKNALHQYRQQLRRPPAEAPAATAKPSSTAPASTVQTPPSEFSAAPETKTPDAPTKEYVSPFTHPPGYKPPSNPMEFEQAMKKWRNIDFESLPPLPPKAQEKKRR